MAFCPQAPALVPDVGRGADAELAEVRAACRAAIGRVASLGTSVVIVGAGEQNAVFGPTSRGSFAGFGVDLTVPLGSEDDGPVELPPSLAVGAWLVRAALGPNSGATGVATVGGIETTLERHGEQPIALVVIGDGSARRTEKAPGYLDERAERFDAAISAALSTGDPTGLRTEPTTAVALLAAGAPAWAAVSRALAAANDRWDAELLYDGAPLGVGYLVAAWTAPSPKPGDRG